MLKRSTLKYLYILLCIVYYILFLLNIQAVLVGWDQTGALRDRGILIIYPILLKRILNNNLLYYRPVSIYMRVVLSV